MGREIYLRGMRYIITKKGNVENHNVILQGKKTRKTLEIETISKSKPRQPTDCQGEVQRFRHILPFNAQNKPKFTS
jgi:hypothetical protein